MDNKVPELEFLLRPVPFLLVAAVPQILLLCGAWSVYSLIRSDLGADCLILWQTLWGAFAFLTVFSCAAAGAAMRSRELLPWWYAPVYLILYPSWLYWMFNSAYKLVPETVPRWIVPVEEYLLLPGGLLMPGLLYAALVVVYRFTPLGSSGWKNLLGAAVLAGVWYLFFHGVLPLKRIPESRFAEHAIVVAGAASTIAFLFLLLRWMAVVARSSGTRAKFVLRALFGIVFPLCGLYVNESFASSAGSGSAGIFGDFSHPLFPLLALLNGAALLLPLSGPRGSQIAVFALRAALFPYTLYFFLAFMPFLPLALLAVVAAGIGFLVLTPTVLFMLHCAILGADFRILRASTPLGAVILTAVTALCLLPAGVAASFFLDSAVLEQALRGLRAPDYLSGQGVSIDRSRLARAVEAAAKLTERRRSMLGHTPILDPLYSRIVLGKLTLSRGTLAELKAAFELTPGIETFPEPSFLPESGLARLSSLNRRTALKGGAFETTIELAIAASPPAERAQEYRAELRLPPGVWVSGLTLRINGEDVPGMIVEKKAGQWVYQQITSMRRDPAILFYTGRDELELRVFPVMPDEERKVTLRLVHRESVSVGVDGRIVPIEAEPGAGRAELHSGLLYISTAAKRSLEQTARIPYPVFIVECLPGGNRLQADAVGRYLKLSGAGSYLITVGSRSFVTYRPGEDWQSGIAHCQRDGTLDADFALKSLILRNHHNTPGRLPVPILVVGASTGVDSPAWFSPFRMLVPDLDRLAVLRPGDGIQWRRLGDFSPMPEGSFPQSAPVLVWPSAGQPKAFFPVDEASGEFLVSGEVQGAAPEAGRNLWQQGAALRAAWLRQLYYQTGSGDEQWRSALELSARSGILTPCGSYIVLETETQREFLRRLNEKRLRGRRTLDAGEMQRMDEPHFAVCLLLLAAAVFQRRRTQGLRRTAIQSNAVGFSIIVQSPPSTASPCVHSPVRGL